MKKSPLHTGMKRTSMRTFASLAAIVLALPFAASADELKWETNMDEAKARAAEEGKVLLVDFTGSDWCGWCIRLKDEVFSKPEFIEFANETFVMVSIDFPRRTQLPEEQVAHNRALMEKYGVRGFPTILLLDAEGEVIAKTGYRQGGPEAYVEHLKEALAAHAAAAGAEPAGEAS